MGKRFVAIGECMIEFAPAPEPGLFAMNFAGDTFNTAWYARRLLPADWSVDYVTATGADSASRRMLEFIAAAGIGTRHVATIPGRTVGLYLIELEGAERHFSYWRGQSAARLLADDPALLAQALEGADLVYFSGITLAILEPDARQRLLKAVADARKAGATIAFDPNLRPRLWQDPATMCAAIMAGAATADIALPSFDDEAQHFGDVNPEATAQRYAGKGCTLVVVKNGAGEITTLCAGRLGRFLPEIVSDPVDTTAAGDSFNAGFLARHLASAALDDALRAGSRVAGQVIRSRGALIPVAAD